ncbi:MAG: C4-dicarboxylate TRAP transporter substrate-binding protein [Rhizobiaceae bacterium]|nr:C4-dicarboxylate TRAP transporter substrate-binding protein [Rhizobiaceae bacterium]
MAPGFPPGSTVDFGARAFTDKATELSNGDLIFEIYSVSVLNVPQMLNGVRDGVADAGVVLPPVFAAQFKETNLIGDLAMLGEWAPAMAGAVTEYIMTCEVCLQEYADNNLVYLGSGSTPDYGILSTKEFTTPDHVNGAKLRSPNAAFNRWIESLGGVALTLPGNEIFEAVKQGVVDGALLSNSELRNIRMIDVVTHITVGAPQGTYHLINIANVNKDVWKDLTTEQRDVLIDAGAYATAAVTAKYVTEAQDALDEAKEKGIEVHEASAELKQATADFIKADMANIDSSAAERGVTDAQEKIARFQGLIDKWAKLTDGLGTDVDSLAALYRTEIYDKLDPQSYGM